MTPVDSNASEPNQIEDTVPWVCPQPYASMHRRLHRRDLAIGCVVSLALHIGLAWGSRFLTTAKPPSMLQTVTEITMVITLPPLEPEPPEGDSSADEPITDLSSLVPPRQPDVPLVVIEMPFVQPLQPAVSGFAIANGVNLLTEIYTGNGAGRRTGNGHGMADGFGQLFNLEDLDQHPVPTFRPPPRFPADMKRAGRDGVVLIAFTVDAQGNVRDTDIVRSSNHAFEEAAIEGVLRWHFRPGIQAGRPVNTRMVIPITFTLDQ